VINTYINSLIVLKSTKIFNKGEHCKF